MEKRAIFGDFPMEFCEYNTSKIVLIPVPYDGTSTWIKGADNGPDVILKASPNLEFYNIETDSEVYRKGIFTDIPVSEKSSPEAMIEKVQQRAAEHIAKDKFVVIIGGEHSVSIGAVKAYAVKYPNLSVLQLDAHSDLRDEYLGSKCNHACVMARIKELCPVVQLGIRSMDYSEKKYVDKDRIFYSHEILYSKKWQDKMMRILSRDVYVTIDVDVFDPGIMPSTGTPEPGGLSWYDVTTLLRKLAKLKNVVGFDIVELCPSENKAPDFMAAKLMYNFLSYIFIDK